MSAERAAQAVLAAMPSLPSGRPVEAILTAVDFAMTSAGAVTGVVAVEVAFPAGTQSARWLGAFAAEVVANPLGPWVGRRVLLLALGDVPIVLGTIHTEGE